MKTQKVCECQNTNFNKNALILFSSNYINWILIATFAQHICENCISTFFHSNRLCHLFCILTSSIWNFRANFFNDEFWNFFRANSFSDVALSAMYCLKLSSKFFRWRKFCKTKLYIDAKIAKTKMNRNSIHVLTWNMT